MNFCVVYMRMNVHLYKYIEQHLQKKIRLFQRNTYTIFRNIRTITLKDILVETMLVYPAKSHIKMCGQSETKIERNMKFIDAGCICMYMYLCRNVY